MRRDQQREADLTAISSRTRQHRGLDRRIIRLAVPALGSIAAEPLYNIADTAIVGHLGRQQLDALAISARPDSRPERTPGACAG